MFACTELKYWIVDRVHIDNLKQIYIIGTTTKLLIYEGRTKNRNCQFTFRFVHATLAPEWDGRDERFDFRKVTKSEMEQFPILKKMLIFGNERAAESLRKVCDPLGIEVEPMACTSV